MPVTYKNPGRIEFTGKILRAEGGGAFVEFPHDVEMLYGVKGRVPVNVTFDGSRYRGSMVKMGGDRHILLILKEIREKLNKDRGDKLRVTVELDEAPRVVELAADVEAAYKKAGVLEAYRSLSFSHQREHALWIEAAKQAETRARRLVKSIDDVRAKKSNNSD
jgi:bifunctional DNA-binding transcriptional regulator/antitoxin component of YhaV-PrlF toxin-antitoxin module